MIHSTHKQNPKWPFAQSTVLCVWRFCITLLCFGLVQLCLLENPVLAQNSTACNLLKKQKQFRLAAECFTQVAKSMKHGRFLDAVSKRQKELLLRQASISYRNQAKQEKNPQERTVLYEKAFKRLEQALSEKLCTKAYQCQALQGSLFALGNKIGYATLTLLNQRGKPIQITLRGYQLERTLQVKSKTVLTLRPGMYQLRLFLPNRSPEDRRFKLSSKGNHLETFSAPVVVKPPKRNSATSQKPNPASVIGSIVTLSIGAALLITGGILLGVSLGGQAIFEQRLNSAKANPTTASET
ncbi:MAG: hypothetical protein AAGJ35_10570, partial [Myxococcota bacterium]